MRLDVYLKRARLIKRRPLAKDYCDRGVVTVNGKAAKAGRPVRPGDEIEIDFPRVILRVKVLEVPSGRVPRGGEDALYLLLHREVKDLFA